MASEVLMKAVKDLLSSPMYIASPELLKKTCWKPCDGFQMNKLYLTPETEDQPLIEATVEWIAQISYEGFKLFPCGGYTDRFSKKFEDTRASAITVSPRHPALRPAWNDVIAAVKAIEASKSATTGVESRGIQNHLAITLEGSNQQGIRIRHQLFLPIENMVEQPDDEQQVKELQERNRERWNLTTWPGKDHAAKYGLDKLLDDGRYSPNPFAAVDANGKTIPPAQWEKSLKGVDVLVKAVIVHQWYGKGREKRDNFYADIRSVTVLHSFADGAPAAKGTAEKRKAGDEVLEGDPKGKRPACGRNTD